jgi:iron(II)-dependent oxidoreductase
MASSALKSRPPDAEQTILALDDARAQTLGLVAHLEEEQLRRVYSPIMSPLVWDLGHIAAYEDLWVAHRHSGMDLLRPELADLYDAFETPRALRGQIEMLGPADARSYMLAVRARSAEALARSGVGDGSVCEMVLRHELQHAETMRQTLAIADLLPAGERSRAGLALSAPAGQRERAGEWVEIPKGPFPMGAGPEGFAYDNERPRHTVEVPAFAIAPHPVSAGAWMDFSRDGGYERSEWWSKEGWAWRQEHGIAVHDAVVRADPRAPVCHVSWFEADAFAHSRGARLPTEAEWEKAARSEGSPLQDLRRVWEWTQSHFGGYPGFVAHPYREYSEVFFGEDYRVLRGGSWATSPRVAGPSFRNWDLPERRQIFAGVRLARDAS